MRALIPAIALCAALQASAAMPAADPGAPAAATKPAVGMLHAQLVTSSTGPVMVAQHVPDAAPSKGGLQAAGTAPATGEEHRPTSGAMLLAALILMTGIALRRWGAGEQ